MNTIQEAKRYIDNAREILREMNNEKSEWEKLRVELNNLYSFNNNWNEAVDLFNNRINKKFLNPVESIVRQKDVEGQGFSAVMILCSLIEMFAAFRVGKIFNFECDKKSPKYDYKGSKNLFVKFLCQDKIFENIF